MLRYFSPVIHMYVCRDIYTKVKCIDPVLSPPKCNRDLSIFYELKYLK